MHGGSWGDEEGQGLGSEVTCDPPVSRTSRRTCCWYRPPVCVCVCVRTFACMGVYLYV